MSAYTPRTGAKCGCKRGVQRDNCPACEGTGWAIDFRAIHARREAEKPRPSLCISCGHATAYGSTAGGCPCTEADRKRAAQALARLAFPEGVKP